MLKLPKWFLRFKYYCGKYHTLQEKRKNSDPETYKYIRAKRKPNKLLDAYCRTKWIKKVYDKSWKNRCKKRHQYEKHKKSEQEIELYKNKISEYRGKIKILSGDGLNEYEKIKSNFDDGEIFDYVMNDMVVHGEIKFIWIHDIHKNKHCKSTFYYKFI